jgi:hypothetical protein
MLVKGRRWRLLLSPPHTSTRAVSQSDEASSSVRVRVKLAEAAVDSVQSDETSTGLLVLVLLRKATVHCLKADESSASLFKWVSVETPFLSLSA